MLLASLAILMGTATATVHSAIVPRPLNSIMNYGFKVYSRLRLGPDPIHWSWLSFASRQPGLFSSYALCPQNLIVLQSAKILPWSMDICSVSVGRIFAKHCPAIADHAPQWHHPKGPLVFVSIDILKFFRSLRRKKFTTSETFHFDHVVVRCG